MKKALIVVGIVVGALLIVCVIGFVLISNTASNGLASLVYEDVDMSQTVDGTYEGFADAGLVSIRLSVTIQDHAISSIDIIEHQNGRGTRAESITQDIIATNNYDVDTISGATISSQTIKTP